MPVDYLSLISKRTQGEHPRTVPAFIIHSALVTKKALDIAKAYLEREPDADLDLQHLEEIGMLHDIGIFDTDTPPLFTTGEGPYITHMQKGHDLLAEEGLPRHAKAAKNHAAIAKEDILEQDLPLAPEDHLPESVEEEILHLADMFYSKIFSQLFHERSVEEVREYLRKYGEHRVEYFDELYGKYCG